MLRAIVTTGTYTENSNIPLTANLSTNSKTTLNSDNTISLKTIGLKNIKANIVFTPTSVGTVSLILLSNGIAISNAIFTQTVADGGTATFTINDVVKVIQSSNTSVANISFQINVSGTLNGGTVIVEHVN